MKPHPVIRILALVFLGAGLFQLGLKALSLVFALLLLMSAIRGREALLGLRKALKRIRWLLLSIVIMGTDSGFLPANADIVLALKRAGILAVLVAAVELLRQTTPAEYTASAIAMLISPLRMLGVDTTRFAKRMALTLEAVPATSELVVRAAGETTIKKGSLAGWAEAAARLIGDIETRKDGQVTDIQLPKLGAPLMLDWLLLAMIALSTLGLTRL
jgi:hypothetical protein